MIQTLKTILSPFQSWFTVDKRILGLYRIFLGILIFSDIFRRWDVRHIFYSSKGIISHSASSAGINKSFSLLHTFNSSFEITLFFIVGMIFSIFLIFGYKTKLSHFIAGAILISIHNKVTLVENAGDFVLNCMIVWTFFLPLGSAISLDSLKYSLKNYPDYNATDLNRHTDVGNYSYSSIAYFAILFQISAIYFFTGLNKNGDDWINGTAIYYFYQLDTFLTPIGAFIRDYVGMTFSKIATYGTLLLEFITPVLLFIPFYSKYLRLLAVILLTIFHLTISASLSIGLFSQTMIISFILLLDGQILESIKSYLKRKNNKNYILFYDSDCGFCHYTARIIKRLDVLNRITFADETFKDKPNGFNNLISKTAIMYDQESKKTWTRHFAFAKVISVIPFGVLISWVFYIPGISYVLGRIYDVIALNRTKISNLFGLPACNIEHHETNMKEATRNSILFNNYIQKFKHIIIFCTVCIFLCSAVNYNLAANKSVNQYMEKADFEKFKYIQFLKPFMNYPRMIQRWDMFSPNVIKTDKWIVIEATLSNGEKIDPFTGNDPILDQIQYETLWPDINQFWRKYFGRIVTKKGTPKLPHVRKLDTWIRTTDYFSDKLNNQKIESIKVWYLTQRNSLPESTKEAKVRKKILFETKINKNRRSNNKKPENILDIIKKNKKNE